MPYLSRMFIGDINRYLNVLTFLLGSLRSPRPLLYYKLMYLIKVMVLV